MQTNISEQFLDHPDIKDAENILRACVHCGFCTATCPTYQLLGDELDGPRGRIYLIKQVLEGNDISRKTQNHLDRCLTCRSCESTCPSGVRYSQLLNIGREVINTQISRTMLQRLQHYGLRKFFLSRQLFPLLLKTAQRLKPLLPESISRSIPDKQQAIRFTTKQHQRKVLLVPGCVQPTLNPGIDNAARIVFDKLGIECIEPASSKCCGSLSHHLNARDEALSMIKNNIDSWLPLIEQHSIEAICMTASGCGVAIREYAQLLAHDSAYADKAKRISKLYKDPAELIAMGSSAELKSTAEKLASHSGNIVFHPPCTLQHGMQLKEVIESFLALCGYNVLPFKDKHLCCGSAGTYSITQKALSEQLLSNKLANINAVEPELIVTANIGCQLHIQSGTNTPVKHWLELFI